MIVEVPIMALVGIAALVVVVVFVLGTALLVQAGRQKRKEDHESVEMPPLIGSDKGPHLTAAAVQPDVDPTFFNKFRKGKSPQYVDPEIPAGSGIDYRGKVNFGLSYDKESMSLKVHIMEAVDLKAMDIGGSSDPYVRVSLLPDRKEVKVTRIHRRTLCPKFGQTLSLPGNSVRALHDMTLCMQVMDYDRFSRDDPIGEVLLPMKNVKFDNSPNYWKHLQKPTVNKETKGELMLSLCYLPETNKVTVVVIKAKDLAQKDMMGSSDPYIKLWLVHQGNKLEKRKTTIKSQTLSPVYNESFAFTVPTKEKLKEVQLVCMIMDYDMLSSNDEIGHVIVGTRGSEIGQKHWKEMMDHPEHPVAMWHKVSPKW